VAVTALVVRLRSEELPPQRMPVVLKHTARESMAPSMSAHEQRALIEDVVQWGSTRTTPPNVAAEG
jgi:hypothetical protein